MSLMTEVTVWVKGVPPLSLRENLTEQVDPDDHREQRLAELDTSAAGGRKVYCGHLFAAMFNYLGPSTVIEFLDQIDWGYSEAVVVIDSEEDDGETRVLRYPKQKD